MGAQAKGGALISIGAQMVTVFEAFKEGIPLLLAVDIHPTPENVEELMGWNLRALQNKTHMRASILNIGPNLWVYGQWNISSVPYES